MSVLNVTALSAGYDCKPVVSLPGLTLEPGQSCLLRGPSGCGKTTLLQAIAGYGRIFSGSVKIGDVSIYDMPEALRDRCRGRKIGLVFQTLHLVKSLTVLDNILLPLFLTGQKQARDEALRVLAALGLEGFAGQPATHLSQGQAQRVALARAMITRPALLLADEPTSSLDDHAARQTLAALLACSRDFGAALIVSSHDARIVSSFSKIITLPAGEPA